MQYRLLPLSVSIVCLTAPSLPAADPDDSRFHLRDVFSLEFASDPLPPSIIDGSSNAESAASQRGAKRQRMISPPRTRSSIWRDRMAENSPAKASRRPCCLATSDCSLL